MGILQQLYLQIASSVYRPNDDGDDNLFVKILLLL